MIKRLSIVFIICFFIANAIPAQAQRLRSRDSGTEREQKENTDKKPDLKPESSVENGEKQPPQKRPSDSRREDSQVIKIPNEVIESLNRENEQVYNESQPVVTEQPNGSVNWTEQYVEAKGATVIDRERFANEAQAKAMATRGAVVVAQRNLLEIINGVQVTSETVVIDMVTSSDVIHTKLDGVIKGAEIVGDPVENMGMMEVVMRVPLYGSNSIAGAVYDEVPGRRERGTEASEAPKGVEVVEDVEGKEITREMKEELFGSLVFDYKGQKIDPSMFPVIIDEDGNLLLDLAKVYDPEQGKFPVYMEASRDLFEGLGIKEGVEIIDVISTKPGTIKIDSGKSKKVDWSKVGEIAGAIGKFLLLFI